MATITWNNSNGGDWNTASDWTPNQVPGSGDDADITASGTYIVTITANVAVNNLTTAPGATLAIGNGDFLALTTGSTITNNGTIALNSTGTGTKISLTGTMGGTITLDGSGALVLGNNANNSIEADQFSLTLVNNSTIEGSGGIGTNVNLNLNNTGTIDADQSTPLILQPSLNNSSPTTNTGTLEATSGGTLQLEGVITNTGGLIQATGANSVVSLTNGVSVTDGTLASSNGGVIQSVSGTLSGAPTITTGSTVSVPNGDVLTLTTGSTITNNGTIALNSTGTGTKISLTGTNGGTITLDGSGALVLGNNANNSIEADQFNLTLINNSTIEGSGAIGTNVNLNLNNTGTIDADQSTPLILQPSLNNSSPTTNTGTLEATNGGTLQLEGIITNTGGLIRATGANSVVSLTNGVSVTGGSLLATGTGATISLNNATISGGTLGGAIVSAAGTTATLENVTVSSGSSYAGTDNSQTIIEGTITNIGTIALGSTGSSTTLRMLAGQTATLTGGGTVSLSNQSTNNITVNAGTGNFINVDNTIAGSGLVNSVTLDNQAKGTIDANQSTPLTLDPGNGFFGVNDTNEGLIEATNGATLTLGPHGSFTQNATGTLLAIGAGSTVLLDAGVVTNSGMFEVTNGGLLHVTSAIAGGGQLAIGASSEIELGGATSELSTFTGAANAKLRLDAPSSYTGTIAGFAPGEILELANTNATTATPTLNGANTTLTVNLNGGGTLTYTLAGNLTNDTFNITHVGPDSDITVTIPLAGQISLAAATEGVALPGTTTVASFTDTNASDTTAAFTATINWGDGSTTSGTVNGSNGAFTVSGGHTYADEGTDPVSVTINRTSDGVTTTPTGNVVVGENDHLSGTGTTINALTNQALSNVVVASFTDTDLVTPASDLVATINWGDGTATTGGTVSGTGGTFQVTGSHTYTSPATDTVTVTLSDDAPGTATATATTTANVTGGALAGQVVLTTATEQVALAAGTTVATFTDSNATDTAGGFTASINWGDGTITTGTVSGSNGSFAVAAGTGGHTYADEGTDPVSVTINRTSDGVTTTPTGNVVVGENDHLSGTGTTINALTNQALSNVVVASFTDTDLVTPASDLVATINWGDGTATTGGTVSGTGGTFQVTGSHTYTSPATDTVTVTLSDDAPGTATVTATTTANVTGGALAGQVVLTTATEQVALAAGTTVATFTDSNATDTAGGFTASINWGDGTITTGTVSGSNGSFAVAAGTGGHTYADEGTDPVSVTINRTSDGVTTTPTGNVVVGENDHLSGTGTTINALTNQALSNVVVASFTDTDLVTPASDLVATINWGDGTATTGGTVSGTGGTFQVTGSHTYTSPATDTVTVTLSDDAPGTATATAASTANVGAQLAVQVTLSGTPQEGQPLTANAASNDAQATIHYQWQSSIDGVSFNPIANAADAATYVVQETDEAHEIRAIVTAVDASTGATASATSSPTATVIDIAPTLSVAVSGTAQEGQTLTAIAKANDSDATISYRWQILNGTTWSNITGATGSTYLVTEANERHQLRVVATSSDPDGSGTTATSTPTAPDMDVTPTISVTESGTAQQGQILTATAHVTSDGDGGVVTYQWQQLVGASWTPITDASSKTYRVTEANENREIRVLATFRDDTGQTVSATSSPTAPVVDVTPALTVTTSGTAQDGRTLTAHPHLTGDGDGGTTTYQWQELVGTTWTNITGATAPTYQVAETNDGRQLRVAATFTDDTNQVTSATSAPTAAVMELEPPPTLTLANHSLSVPAGGSVALPISVASFDADDTVFVVINHVQPWESVTDNLDHLTFSAPTDVLSAAEVNSGLTLQVSSGAPLIQSALTFTAINTTAGDKANTGTQSLFVTVTDPPASASGPATLGQPFAAASNPAPLHQLLAVFDQFIAAGFDGSQNGTGPITTISPPPTSMGDLSFLSNPHH